MPFFFHRFVFPDFPVSAASGDGSQRTRTAGVGLSIERHVPGAREGSYHQPFVAYAIKSLAGYQPRGRLRLKRWDMEGGVV